jgi:hypothetical protein
MFLNCGIKVSFVLQWHLGVSVLLTGERNNFIQKYIFHIVCSRFIFMRRDLPFILDYLPRTLLTLLAYSTTR